MDEARSAIYLIPYPRFFSQFNGVGGHVAHANGVVQGLQQSGFSLDVILEEHFDLGLSELQEIHIVPLGTQSLLRRLVWSKALLNQIRFCLARRKQQFVYMRYSAGFSPALPALKRVLGRTPLVVELNSFGAQHCKWLRYLERYALRSADVILCVSETVAQLVSDLLDPELQDKILILPNGVDVERFAPNSEQYENARDIWRLGYTGILKANYGLEDMLDAFSKIRATRNNVELHIYGEGPHRHALERYSSAIQGVIFHGAVPFVEVPGILRGLDIVLYASSVKNRYQSPIKLYEYMAAAKPIVAAGNPQVLDLLGNDQRGLVFEPGDSDGMARQIIRLLDDHSLRHELAMNALNHVREHHSWSKRIADLVGHLEKRGLLHG
jgi:glycosyltransferase involved in cell wall biosynthesis